VFEDRKKILEMLARNEISVQEAERLLNIVEPEGSESRIGAGVAAKPKPRYLRVAVRPGPEHEHDDDAERVDIRLPMSLIRSGIKLTSLMPDQARDKVSDALHEKGIRLDVRNLETEDLEEIIEALADLEVSVESGREVVKVFAE
jgi:hypothetical protein